MSSLDPNTLARELQTQADPVTFQTPREVTVAGWGKTRDRYESQQNKLVSDTSMKLTIFSFLKKVCKYNGSTAGIINNVINDLL